MDRSRQPHYTAGWQLQLFYTAMFCRFNPDISSARKNRICTPRPDDEPHAPRSASATSAYGVDV